MSASTKLRLVRNGRAPRRVGLLSPCGWGNLGDAAIMAAAIENIRARIPGVEIFGITLNPDDTESRHHVPALLIGGWSHPEYGVLTPKNDPLGFVDRGVERLRRVSWRLYRIARIAANSILDISHSLRGCLRLGRSDILVVCGGGQIDEFWGGPWGHPFALWKWSLLARLRGAKLVVLSTGHGTLASGLGRFFVRRALRRAQYVSYRTKETQQFARELEVTRRDFVVPDLAFSLPIPMPPAPGHCRRKTVGVSLIAWCDPRCWPEKDGARYQHYLAKMTSFVRWLLDHDYRVTLFASDNPDHQVAADLVAELEKQGYRGLESQLVISPANTVASLFNLFRDLEIVVASRLHGIILAYLAGLPTVAVSYDPKVDWLVGEFSLAKYWVDIANFSVESLVERFEAIVNDRLAITRQIQSVITSYRSGLDKQYNNVLGIAYSSQVIAS